MGKILVTGASGHLGSAVVKHLLETYGVSATDIVAGSRNTEKLKAISNKGVELRKVDFDDAQTLDTGFAGIDTLLLISTDALAVKGQRLTQHKAAIQAAKRAGIKRIVYTSLPNPETSLITFAPDHLGTEQAVQQSGISYVILRNAWYLDNYLHSLSHDLQSGKWFSWTGNGKISAIARNDCARAAAAVLAKGISGNKTLTLTGPQSLTISEIAKIASDLSAKPLEVIAASEDQLRAGMTGAGLPDFVIDMLLSAEANIASGNFDLITSDYETLTGERPQSAEEFFKAHKAALSA